MSEFLEPIRKRLRARAGQATEYVNEVLVILGGLRRLRGEPVDQKLEQAEESILHAYEAILRMKQEWLEYRGAVDQLTYKAAEAAEVGPGLVDKLADDALVIEHYGQTLNVAYIQCAHHLLALADDLIDATVREIASHDGGEVRLAALKTAIEKLEQEVSND